MYTRSGGYCLCLCLFPKGLNLEFSGYMSVTVFVLPGRYNDTLKWPIEGSLKVEILNQLGDHSHYGKTLDLVKMPKKYRERPKQDPTKCKESSWGIVRFIDHHSLLSRVHLMVHTIWSMEQYIYVSPVANEPWLSFYPSYYLQHHKNILCKYFIFVATHCILYEASKSVITYFHLGVYQSYPIYNGAKPEYPCSVFLGAFSV